MVISRGTELSSLMVGEERGVERVVELFSIGMVSKGMYVIV
jgi:hypothetical protein